MFRGANLALRLEADLPAGLDGPVVGSRADACRGRGEGRHEEGPDEAGDRGEAGHSTCIPGAGLDGDFTLRFRVSGPGLVAPSGRMT